MADIIQLLPDYVANQIAAGEVVQRPASVVKELVENAVDAKATEIKLIIKDSGKTIIQVIDDGIGMSVTDLRMAFERHATSKIRETKDLFDIRTKGFRGEALASIAAVSQLECTSRLEKDEIGNHLVIEGGKYISQDIIAANKGTSISVKNLFYNIPARRNFLKSDPVEFTHILNEFQRVALAHTSISFSLINDKKGEILRLIKGNLKKRIVEVFGNKMSERLIPVKEQTDLIKISGYIVKPEFSKKSRGEQFFFVNNRFIKSPYLHHAMVSAFEGLLQNNFHPSYFLFFEVPESSIDINIHPTKTEVKFENENVIYAILRSAVKHALGQFSVAPIDFQKSTEFDIPYHYKTKKPSAPIIEVDPNFNPFKEKNNSNTYLRKPKEASWEVLYTKKRSEQETFEHLEIASEKFQDSHKSNNANFKGIQIYNKYIFYKQENDKAVIIHQTRAHQRVLYEKFKRELSQQKNVCQQLILPLKLEFSTLEIELLKTLQKPMESMGFSINISKKELEVHGVPILIKGFDIKEIIETLIADYDKALSDNPMTDYIGKTFCKSLAFKTNEVLDPKTIEQLLEDLFNCDEFLVSPFKKPIFVNLEFKDIDKLFHNR